MLVIRLQRTGRKSRAFYRLVVQDSRRTPTSGKVVALVGHYDPHSKDVVINQERVKFFLDHGAQPSETVIRLLIAQKIELPNWVKKPQAKSKNIKNKEKLRKNRDPEAEVAEESVVDDQALSQDQEAQTTQEPVEAKS
jgi:small subunit ribosomal protein S16